MSSAGHEGVDLRREKKVPQGKNKNGGSHIIGLNFLKLIIKLINW